MKQERDIPLSVGKPNLELSRLAQPNNICHLCNREHMSIQAYRIFSERQDVL
jgi:hypothetical protein